MKLPDCEFFHSYAYDGPSINSFRPSPPVISQGYNEQFSGNFPLFLAFITLKHYNLKPLNPEIPAPTTGQIRWLFNGDAVKYAAIGRSWKERKPIAFFRGSRTGKNRRYSSFASFPPASGVTDQRGFFSTLFSLSRKIADLKYNDRFRLVMVGRNHSSIDAKILARFNANDDKRTVAGIYDWARKEGLVTNERSPEDSIKDYKYVINPDGNAASWRMYYEVVGPTHFWSIMVDVEPVFFLLTFSDGLWVNHHKAEISLERMVV